MKASKIVKLVGRPPIVCAPLTFPLTNEDLTDIESLKMAFRNSFSQFKIYSLGMAAPQIQVNKRFLIIPKDFRYGLVRDFDQLKHKVKQFNVYINPIIRQVSQQLVYMNQYCLSVNDSEYKVLRPKFVQVEYYNENGIQRVQSLDQLRSRIFQHEYDHLQGKLMIDYPDSIQVKKKGRKGRRTTEEKFQIVD